jgi:hypothetical protein
MAEKWDSVEVLYPEKKKRKEFREDKAQASESTNGRAAAAGRK